MGKRVAFIMMMALVANGFAAAERYEAESAIVDENSVEIVQNEDCSGGSYVNMKEGNLSFEIDVKEAGFYTLWASYSQPFGEEGKIQNLTLNGSSAGQISFPYTETFTYQKASAKVKLAKGTNKIGITHSWGWVNIDYIELTVYEPVPFDISAKLVTPNASENARKMYSFLKENFGKKVISGVMTNRTMENDGKNTPFTVEKQEEVAWIIDASKKAPALLGFDFMHGTGASSDNMWHIGYTSAAISMAEDMFKKGGIPAFCWHWKDPSKKVEAFYTESSGNTPYTEFSLIKAFTDSTCESFDESSSEYKAIVNDIDIVAGYLKQLAEKNVSVLWRPLHEASGKWFWWGYCGARACKALYIFMFDRLTNFHKLDNLIWVWTTDEASDALDWYPGDKYVDIVGRDYYYYPREANHGSLVASFEKVKDIYGGKKIVALSENGSVPHPDSMKADGAAWSYFMPWYGDYTMDGWAHDNTASDWNEIMNHDYVITLDEMPGWDNYEVFTKRDIKRTFANDNISVRYSKGLLYVNSKYRQIKNLSLYSLNGTCLMTYKNTKVDNRKSSVNLGFMSNGVYLLRIETPE
ncbi:MAG: glycosyl hydrolase, partial [Fibrobacter sp.]|nr:glycosyl hydrolase [Fibrobacter sp.]